MYLVHIFRCSVGMSIQRVQTRKFFKQTLGWKKLVLHWIVSSPKICRCQAFEAALQTNYNNLQ